jgi:RND family efflux transporter MFP subunit
MDVEPGKLDEAGRAGRRGAALLWVVLALVGLAVGGFVFWGDRGPDAKQEMTLPYVAVREKLRISVVESGQLKAAKSVDIYCEVKGGATILELVDEGTKVHAGDTLVQLDASNLEDELTAQKIKKLNAEAAFIQADKTKQIQVSKNESDIQKAEVDRSVAERDLEKYQKGDFPLKEKQAESDITLATADAENKRLTAEQTTELVQLNFAAMTEKTRDDLAAQQAEVKTEMAKLSKQVLEEHERPRQELVLKNTVDQTTAELERVKLRCEADLAQKNADYESKKATFDLEKNKLADLEEQVDKTTIKAPSDGLVVYPMNQNGMGGRGGSDRDRIEEGATAREHQLMLSLPDASEMVVVVSVHESAIDKLKLDQPALVTIDARPDLSFVGKVTFIAPLPDSQNQWLNPDLKVYRCEITLGGDTSALRPGMSAGTEIVIDELADAIAVPIHAVHHRGSRYYVYVADADGKAVVREVRIGLHNDNRVAVLEGLAEGDQVFLAVPNGAPQPDFPADERSEGTSVEDLRRRAGTITVKGKGPEEQRPGMGRQGDRAAFMKMTPEEQKKAMEAMEERRAKMTPEERAKFDERMKQWQNRGGGSGGAAAPAGGGAPAAGSGGGGDGKTRSGGGS